MKFRQLPRTELVLSEVGFGVWTVATAGWGRMEDAERAALLENAVELGINFFDTADSYGDGYGEEILARLLGHKRYDLVIATKFGYDIYDPTPRERPQERPKNFDRQYIRYACEQSLRRLNTDYIDLYQVHFPGVGDLEREELFEALEQLQFEGKIRYYGVALGPEIGWREEGEMAMRQWQVHGLQIIYNILEMEPAVEFFPIAGECEVGLISRAPHARGALAGEPIRMPVFEEPDRRAEWATDTQARVDRLRFLEQEDSRTLAQSAIQFALHRPQIVSVLPDITTLEELREYAAAVDTPPLNDGEQDYLDELWQNRFYLEDVEPAFREI